MTIRGGKPEEAEFEQFIVPYFDCLFRRACRLTGDSDEAEDLVQEACIRAFESFDELRSMNNPTGWLLRVLYHLFIDSTRRSWASRTTLRSVMNDDGSFVDLPSAEPEPAEHAETELLRRRLQEALMALSPVEQVMLVLREIEGYSLAEIAHITELPESTAKSRLHRARIKLGRLLQHAEYALTVNARGSNNELPRRHHAAG